MDNEHPALSALLPLMKPRACDSYLLMFNLLDHTSSEFHSRLRHMATMRPNLMLAYLKLRLHSKKVSLPPQNVTRIYRFPLLRLIPLATPSDIRYITSKLLKTHHPAYLQLMNPLPKSPCAFYHLFLVALWKLFVVPLNYQRQLVPLENAEESGVNRL